MNRSLKLLLLLVCASTSLLAQDFQGKATYKVVHKLKFKMEGNGMTPAMQKSIQEMLDKQGDKEYTYTLAFDAYSSLYKFNESLELSPKQSGGLIFMGTASASGGFGDIYKNTKEKRYTSSKDLFGKPFLVKGDLETTNWKLTKETKQIGQYTCYKATYDRKQISLQSITVNNEVKSKTEPETTKAITVEAWYTPDIPVAHGPEMYWGLPGLVMEVQDGNSTLICTEVVLNPKEKIEINEPDKGKVISDRKYATLVQKKVEEMNKMNSGGKKKGDAHSISISTGG